MPVFGALSFALPQEAATAIELFEECRVPSQQLQQALFEKLCAEAAVPAALDHLRYVAQVVLRTGLVRLC